MTDGLTLSLWEPTQAHKAIESAWRYIKAATMAGHRLVLTVKPETRSTAQNAMLHAMLQDVADQVPWAGKKRDVTTWKRLMTAAWLRARGDQVVILPAIDGHGVDIIFERTSRMTKAQVSELCDFIGAWAVERGVEFSEVADVPQ